MSHSSPSTTTPPRGGRLSRRGVLGLGAGAALAAAVSLGGGTAHAAHTAPADRITRRLRALEQEHSARLGVYGRNLATGRTVLHRADELFPICSVFKAVAAAAVLRDLDHDGEHLARRIRYTTTDLKPHSPITEKPENLASGMTVEELCDATIRYSDNAAGNLLLRELGGPTAITRFCRSIGDPVTRLDRWETELNSAEPWRVEDTTSPRAIGRTYTALTVGTALNRADRRRLTEWLLGNTTSDTRFRAGLPDDWTLADKTGGGEYGTNNDVGIAWTPHGEPVALAVLTTRAEPDAQRDDLLVARTAALLASALG